MIGEALLLTQEIEDVATTVLMTKDTGIVMIDVIEIDGIATTGEIKTLADQNVDVSTNQKLQLSKFQELPPLLLGMMTTNRRGSWTEGTTSKF
jgi:hypothetical protein